MMKATGIALLSLSLFVNAQEEKRTYYSYAGLCNTYVYIFDVKAKSYDIYAKYDVSTEEDGAYSSYQLTQGRMSDLSSGLYNLTAEGASDLQLDLTDSERPVLNGNGGSAVMHACSEEVANELITSTLNYLEKCESGVLSCKPS